MPNCFEQKTKPINFIIINFHCNNEEVEKCDKIFSSICDSVLKRKSWLVLKKAERTSFKLKTFYNLVILSKERGTRVGIEYGLRIVLEKPSEYTSKDEPSEFFVSNEGHDLFFITK